MQGTTDQGSAQSSIASPQASPTIAVMASGSQAPASSPLAVALDLVGDRWSLLVVEVLLDGSRRFNELVDALPGIAPNILADRLRRLERDGVVIAAAYSRRPPRMDYSLTADGRDLAGALRMLADWGVRRANAAERGGHEPLRHQTCGTQLEARWYCPTCTVTVVDDEAEVARSV